VTDPAPADRADTDAGLVNPHAVLAVLADVVGPDDVVTSGAGQHAVWATLLPVDRPGQFLKSAGLGTMGYGLPAGLGAATEADGTAFVLVGDGDLAMSCGELWSCVQAGVDVVVVVFDDAQLSAIKTTQQDRYDRTVGVDHVPADLAAVAEGFGAHGVRVETGDDVEAAVEAAVAVDGPALVDVAVDPDVEAPSFFYESR
jgi:acetolactate synthase-1/2/3 large subunit